MTHSYLLLFLLLPLFACQSGTPQSSVRQAETNSIQPQIQAISVPSSVRAIEAIDEQHAWFAGSGGVYGYSENAGQDWVIDSIRE
ncbi:MAG: hypothetical protein AAFP02_13315, partial [Bacteroidota bacterium]